MTARIEPSAFVARKENTRRARSATAPRGGKLLAPWTYGSEEFLGLEVEVLFKRRWLLAGHVSDLPDARDYLTFNAFGESALVVRGNDNRLRAFHNVCRHRGARLLDDDLGQCPHRLTCPFHGWTYDLDGALLSVPAVDTFENLDLSKNGLAPLRMEIWMGFIFVRFRGDDAVPSVAQSMQPAERLLAPYRMSDMAPIAGARFGQTRPTNWKVIHDVDNEGYHVPLGHPTLQQLYGRDYRDELVAHIPVSFAYLNEKQGKLWSVRHYQKLLPGFDHLPAEQQRLWLYVGVFPNLVLAMYPDGMEFYMTIPVSAESTRFVGGAYALPDARREVRAARYLNARINRITDREDNAFVRRLQAGMKSSAFPEPHLSSKEPGVREFHDKIRRALPVANLAEAPAAGAVAQVNAEMSEERAA